MKMEKEYASAPASGSSTAPITSSIDDNDDDDKPVYKSAQDLVDEAKISKSIWGGAFAAPAAPRIQ